MWVISHDQPAIIPDIYNDARVLVSAYRSTFVRSMAMVPVGKPSIAAIGAYWAQPHTATPSKMDTLAAIADSALIETADLHATAGHPRHERRSRRRRESSRRVEGAIAHERDVKG